jgi:urease accessory protein UreH
MDDRLALFEQLMLQPKQDSYAGVGMLDRQSTWPPVCFDLPGLQPMDQRVEPLPDRAVASASDHRARIRGLVVRLLGQTGQEVLRRLDAAHRLIREEGLGCRHCRSIGHLSSRQANTPARFYLKLQSLTTCRIH